MIENRTLVLAVAAVLASHSAVAAIYKTVDEHGNVVYTDDPAGNGKPVELPPLSTVPPPRYRTATPSAAAAQDEQRQAVRYQQLKITAPTQDETLRDNPGNIWIKADINPELDVTAGHRLQFYLDGKPAGEAGSAEKIMIPNVDRGTHTASVAVVDAGGAELRHSDEVRFYLHRQSVNFPTRNNAKP